MESPTHHCFLCCQPGYATKLTGASGLGRTTFINTLCDADVVPKRESDDPEMAHIEEGIKIKPYNVGKERPFTEVQGGISKSLFFVGNSG